MDYISSLPENILFQIFNYLPLIDRFRAGHVSKTFRRMSGRVISETEQLWNPYWDMEIKEKENNPPHWFHRLIELCSKNLKEIKISSKSLSQNFGLPMVLAQYSCPKLTKIDIRIWDLLRIPTIRDKIVLGALLRNSPNLEYLDLHGGLIEFPNNILCDKLTTLRCFANDDSLRSMIDRVPNLKKIKIFGENITMAVLDRFFKSVGNLESFALYVNENNNVIDFEQMNHFWSLNSLTRLYLKNEGFRSGLFGTDNVCRKISASFLNMENLEIYFSRISGVGIRALSSLNNLRILRFRNNIAHDGDEVGESLRELKKCQRLENIEVFNAIVSRNTFEILIRSCPQLTSLGFNLFSDGVETKEDAIELLNLLLRIGKRKLHLTVRDLDYSIWFDENMNDENGEMKQLYNTLRSEGINFGFNSYDSERDIIF